MKKKIILSSITLVSVLLTGCFDDESSQTVIFQKTVSNPSATANQKTDINFYLPVSAMSGFKDTTVSTVGTPISITYSSNNCESIMIGNNNGSTTSSPAVGNGIKAYQVTLVGANTPTLISFKNCTVSDINNPNKTSISLSANLKTATGKMYNAGYSQVVTPGNI